MSNQTNLSNQVPVSWFHSGQQARDDGPRDRLTTGKKDIGAAQAPRYRVFFEEMNGRPSIAAIWRKRDVDLYDPATDLLWAGISNYLHAYNIGLTFGTIGFPGTDPNKFLNALALLHHRYRAPPKLRPRALP